MSKPRNHWQDYHRRWSGLQAPLRPTLETVAIIQQLVGRRDARVLLLGVTRELAMAFPHILAVDKNIAMIKNLWPGDTATRTAREADWQNLDASWGRFSAVVGDGSCNSVTYPDELRQVLKQVHDRLEPGGCFVCRIYERPVHVPSTTALQAQGSRPAEINFHAFKWQLAMRIAEDTEPTVPVASILKKFEDMFTDRGALAQHTGWPRADIDTIDAYRNSSVAYCFPNRAELLRVIPPGLGRIQFHASGAYDLAEWCPILVCERSE
jgi:SAM-dependent methyltransferase